jgi:hypothetical protein
MANIRGRRLALRANLRPSFSTWAWLGSKHSHSTTQADTSRRKNQLRDIKKEATTPDCPATIPPGPGTTPLNRARLKAALSSPIAPVSGATIYRGPSASQTRIQRYIIARDHRRLLPYTAAWLYAGANTAGKIPIADAQTKHGILATAL